MTQENRSSRQPDLERYRCEEIRIWWITGLEKI